MSSVITFERAILSAVQVELDQLFDESLVFAEMSDGSLAEEIIHCP